MKIEPKRRGWKEGVIVEDLISAGGTIHKKGDTVRYKRCRQYDSDDNTWRGNFEYHYLNQQNYNLIRCSRLLVKEK